MAFTMKFPSPILSLCYLSSLVFAQAPVVENNPAMVTFQAILNTSKSIQGTLTGVSAENGTGVNFNINFFSFPDAAVGPFGRLMPFHGPQRTRAPY
jgi:hypothetical protein